MTKRDRKTLENIFLRNSSKEFIYELHHIIDCIGYEIYQEDNNSTAAMEYKDLATKIGEIWEKMEDHI